MSPDAPGQGAVDHVPTVPDLELNRGGQLDACLPAEVARVLPVGGVVPVLVHTEARIERSRRYFRLLRYARMSPTSCALSVCHAVFRATIRDSIPEPCSHIPATIQ